MWYDNGNNMMLSMFQVILVTMTLFALLEDNTPGAENAEETARLAETVALITLRLKRHREGEHDGPRRKRTVVNYDHRRAAMCVQHDYWGPNPIFRDRQFERVFRITRAYADRILQVAANTDPFFTEVPDVCGKFICPKVKILMALKCLAYGVSPSAFQDYFQMGETTGRECVKRLARVVANDPTFQQDFRRSMNRSDARKLSALHEQKHGFAGMIGSLDCMHTYWRV
jgi:hypothetical protein